MSTPLRIGTRAEFACVREFLTGCAFADPDAVARAFRLEHLYEFSLGHRRAPVPELPEDGLDLCLRLFLEGRTLPLDFVRQVAGEPVTAALTALGLLEPTDVSEGHVWSPVALYPVSDVVLASDRWTNADGTSRVAADDTVYAALVRNTNSFLALMLETPCERFLEMCAGTGVAALHAARNFATTAYSYDITDRCRAFAEFNAALNGLDNVVVGQGDLYEPAGELQFDRIVAHPPYVPVLRHRWIYHSGGNDGEKITRRIIEGLPKYLAPGGTFICLAAATDRSSGDLEQRLRQMLGDSQDEFDVTVVVRSTMEPAVFAFRQLMFGTADRDDVKAWRDVFQELGVRRVVYGPIIIQRHATPRKAFTIRREVGPRSTPREIWWALEWERMQSEGGLEPRLLASRLATVPGSRLRIDHDLDGADDWEANAYHLVTAHPFAMQCENSPFLALVTSRLQKPSTGQELFDQLKREGVLHPQTDPAEFCEALCTLVAGGFIETDLHPLPRHTGQTLHGIEGDDDPGTGPASSPPAAG